MKQEYEKPTAKRFKFATEEDIASDVTVSLGGGGFSPPGTSYDDPGDNFD